MNKFITIDDASGNVIISIHAHDIAIGIVLSADELDQFADEIVRLATQLMEKNES